MKQRMRRQQHETEHQAHICHHVIMLVSFVTLVGKSLRYRQISASHPSSCSLETRVRWCQSNSEAIKSSFSTVVAREGSRLLFSAFGRVFQYRLICYCIISYMCLDSEKCYIPSSRGSCKPHPASSLHVGFLKCVQLPAHLHHPTHAQYKRVCNKGEELQIMRSCY